jgi:predicted transcriptional regulator
MEAVWQLGACPVEAVHQVVSQKRKLKETSVRTILRRLEQKGYLQHEEQGRAYVYRAPETARSLPPAPSARSSTAFARARSKNW